MKQRPRLGRGRRVYTPEKTLEFEAAVRRAWNGPMWDTPVSMEIELHKEHIVVTISSIEPKPSPLRGDIDNYAKSIMDGLNNAAYVDDRLVRELKVVKK